MTEEEVRRIVREELEKRFPQRDYRGRSPHDPAYPRNPMGQSAPPCTCDTTAVCRLHSARWPKPELYYSHPNNERTPR